LLGNCRRRVSVRLCRTLAISCLFALVFGCGKFNGKEQVTINFNAGVLSGFITARILDTYREARPGIAISVTDGPDQADVFICDGSSLDAGGLESLLDLKRFIEKDLYDMRQHPDICIRAATRGQRIIGLPVSGGGAVVLYLNRDSPVAPPEGKWSAQELKAALEEARRTNRETGLLGCAPRYLRDIIRPEWKFWIETPPSPIQSFIDGKLAILAADSTALPKLRSSGINFEISPVPDGFFGEGTVFVSLLCVISKNCLYPERAWDFAKFLASAYVTNELMRSGLFPARYEFLRPELFADDSTPYREEIFLSEMKRARLPDEFKPAAAPPAEVIR